MLFVLGIGLDKRRLVKKMVVYKPRYTFEGRPFGEGALREVVKSCGHKVAAISRLSSHISFQRRRQLGQGLIISTASRLLRQAQRAA